MKIAFFVTSFPKLSETFVLNQMTGLIDRGNDLDIFAVRSSPYDKSHPEVKEYDLLTRTHYRSLPGKRATRILTSLKLLATTLCRNPSALLKIYHGAKGFVGSSQRQLFYDSIPHLSNGTYDAIHCHFGPNGVRALALKKLGLLRGKLITAFHAYDLTSYVKANGPGVYSQLFKEGQLFLPISEHGKHLLVELGCDPDKIIVHRMGIDCDKFQFVPRIYQHGKTVQLLTVARLVEKKGVEYAIRAVAKLVQSGTNIQYTVIGDGPLFSHLQSLIEELQVSDSIKLLGWKHQGEVSESLYDAHILLAPSVTAENGDQEGIPVALMEAMATGLPVISTFHSGIPELVCDGISGLLVPERDVNALVDKVRYLIDHPEAWPPLIESAHAIIREHYEINKLNNRLLDIYRAG